MVSCSLVALSAAFSVLLFMACAGLLFQCICVLFAMVPRLSSEWVHWAAALAWVLARAGPSGAQLHSACVSLIGKRLGWLVDNTYDIVADLVHVCYGGFAVSPLRDYEREVRDVVVAIQQA